MLIKDLQSGVVRKYGTDCHDSLAISEDGRTLSYYNLQCGEGSKYGDYRFVMEDGEAPQDSNTPEALNFCCYFNIGGFETNVVCEWEKGSSGYVGIPAYYSKCCTTKSKGLEMPSNIISDWKHCPYCGRNIKVVE